MKFENTFWTSDYISGIRVLLQTLEKSHEEGLDSLEYFESYTELLDIQSAKLKQLSIKSDKFLEKQPTEAIPSKILSEYEQHQKLLGSLSNLKRVQSESIKTIGVVKSSASLKIQGDVVIRLRDFLEDYSEFIIDSKKSLTNQYNTFVKTNEQAIAAEKVYINKTRELEDIDLRETQSKATVPSPDSLQPPPPVEKSAEIIQETEDEIFKFPIVIGTTIFRSIKELKVFMIRMTGEVPIKRRLIPLPGINNEYFGSESFFRWVKGNRENEDSRRKIEKFGQDLIKLGLVSNWNKLAQNKFVSDEGYYEFTDLARYIAKFDENKIPVLEVSPSEESSEIKSKSGVFDGLKNRFKHTLDINTLKDNAKVAKEKYLAAVSKSYIEKEKLESSIISVSRRAEVYEANRLKLIYFLTKIFNETVLDENEKQIHAFQTIAEASTYDDDTFNYELLKRSISNKSGWYWPKSDVKFSSYGNSKTQFNAEIFGNDLLNQYRDPSNNDLKTKSVPLFLKNIIEGLNGLELVEDSWIKDIDILKATEMKRSILLSIPEYEKEYNPEEIDIDINNFVSSKITSEIFHKYSTNEVVGFLKLWLLELPDSLIPFTAYDQLKTCYSENSDDYESKLKILGSIPRQNLASLLLLAEHLSSSVSKIEQLVKNEKVPLFHLFIRPSPKNLHANLDDIVVFKPLCEDLLNNNYQNSLHKKLEELEEIHTERERRAEESLQRLKQAPKELTPPQTIPKSTSNNSLTVDGLRPFKTISPVPSPVSSPKVGRSRTNSNLFSPLRRPSDSLHKKTFSKSLDKQSTKEEENQKSGELTEQQDQPSKQEEESKADENSGGKIAESDQDAQTNDAVEIITITSDEEDRGN